MVRALHMVRALDRPGSSSFLSFGDFEPQSGGSEGDGRTVAQDCRAQDLRVPTQQEGLRSAFYCFLETLHHSQVARREGG